MTLWLCFKKTKQISGWIIRSVMAFLLATIAFLILISVSIVAINWINKNIFLASDDALIQKSNNLNSLSQHIHMIARHFPEESWSIDPNNPVLSKTDFRNVYFTPWLRQELVLSLQAEEMNLAIYFSHNSCIYFRNRVQGLFPSYSKNLYHCKTGSIPDCGPVTKDPLEPYYKKWVPFAETSKTFDMRIQRDIGRGWFICLEYTP